jgi:hypothetical protein
VVQQVQAELLVQQEQVELVVQAVLQGQLLTTKGLQQHL